MQKYTTDKITSEFVTTRGVFGVYLAPEVDEALRREVADAEARVRRDEKERQGGRIAAAVKREREEIANNLQAMINSVPEMAFDQKIGVRKVIVYIRSRGESKPEPRLGTNPPTATATMMKIEYCRSIIASSAWKAR
jgi:hypothetical protein